MNKPHCPQIRRATSRLRWPRLAQGRQRKPTGGLPRSQEQVRLALRKIKGIGNKAHPNHERLLRSNEAPTGSNAEGSKARVALPGKNRRRRGPERTPTETTKPSRHLLQSHQGMTSKNKHQIRPRKTLSGKPSFIKKPHQDIYPTSLLK